MEQRGKTHEVGVHHRDGIWRRHSQKGWVARAWQRCNLRDSCLHKREQKAWLCAEDTKNDSVRHVGGSVGPNNLSHSISNKTITQHD